VTINQELDSLPSEKEVRKAIERMLSGKAPGSDAIPTEIYKVGGPAMLCKLTQLYQSIWNDRTIPQQFP